MNKGGLFEEILEQGGSIVKQTAKTVTNAPTGFAKTAAQQISGGSNDAAASNAATKAPNQKGSDNGSIPTPQPSDNKEFVKMLYGKSDQSQTKNPTPQVAQTIAQQYPEKTPEEVQKIALLTQQLHKETYYDPTFNPAKQQEERPVEKVEREKKEEQMELQQKEEKKPEPLAVRRGRESAEKYRGAAG